MSKLIPQKQQRSMFEQNLIYIHTLLDRFKNLKYVMGIDPSLRDTAIGVNRIGWNKMLFFDSPDIIREKAKEFTVTHRIALTREYLLEKLKEFPSQLVVLEGYAYGSMTNREVMGEVGGMIRLDVLYDNPEIAGMIVMVGPTQLKKYILGAANVGGGQKTKQMIILNVFKRYNIEVENDNQADALVLTKIASDLIKFVKKFGEINFENDKEIRLFMRDGWQDYGYHKYQWEVLCSLMINKCDSKLFAYRKP